MLPKTIFFSNSILEYEEVEGTTTGRSQTGSEPDTDHAMVRAHQLRLRMKAARLSNHPAKVDLAKLKITVLENLCLEFSGDASPEVEWRRGHRSFRGTPRKNAPSP